MTAPQLYKRVVRVQADKKIAGVCTGFGAYFNVDPIFVRLLLILSLLVATEQVLAEMRKAPYVMYAGTNTEMEVHWQLTTTTPCTFDWGTDTSYSTGTGQTQEYGNDHQHRYTVPGLMPGSKYYYRVTLNQQRFTGSFLAAPAYGATNLKFIAYGDTRSYPASHDTVANAILTAIRSDSDYQSLVIFGGDFVTDGNTESYWDSEFFNPAYTHIQSALANLPYQSCMGNHEGTGTLFTKYFPYPVVASHYWSFDYGPVHFSVLDQYTSYGQGSAELTWLANDLATSSKPWKFILLHEPGWSAGGGHENNVTVQNYIQPLCEQYGVSIVFGGHNHYYARAMVNGVQHITTGGGGAPLYTPNPGYPNIVATSRTHHFCKVALDSSLLHFTAITPSGAVIDTFSMTRPMSYVAGQTAPHPTKLELSPAYPNPFNPSTEIQYDLPKAEHISLRVFDLLGREVAVLKDGFVEAGSHRVMFDGSNLASGIYFARLNAGSFSQTKKLMLLK